MTSDLHRKAMQRECFNTAVENAVRDANQQQIFALHRAAAQRARAS